MEEEIITPEEETFDYSKLRYILDKDGYVCHASVGGFIVCDSGECTEYNGKTPEGYETIDEWYEVQINEKKLNSWKIVEGDLVFDANRDYKLRVAYEREEDENRFVTRKELGIKNTNEVNPYANLYPSVKSVSNASFVGTDYFDRSITNIGDLPVEEVTISNRNEEAITGLIELDFIGDNMLPNNAISTTNNGIKYTIDIDKAITATGIATEKSTLNLDGTETSVKSILSFEGHIAYLVRGLPENVNLELYHYDGQDRMLIGTYKNEDVINFDVTTRVTQTVLSIESGITISSTIEPRILQIGIEYPFLPTTKYEEIDERYGQYYVEGQYAAGTYYALTQKKIYKINLISELRSDGDNSDRLWIIDEGTYGVEIERYDNETIEKVTFSADFSGYEEYRCNSTLIDLVDNELTTNDIITIKNNQIILVKNNTSEDELEKSYIFLGNTPMPRCYTPYSAAIAHQDGTVVRYTYRDPRNINMSKVNLGNLIQVMDIESEYDFTTADADKVTSYSNGETLLTDEELEMYDINGDGIVNKEDANIITSMCNGEISNTVKGTLELNTAKSQRTIVLRDEEDKIKTSIGLGGMTTPSLSCDKFYIGGTPMHEAATYSEKETVAGTWFGKTLYRKTIVFSITSTSSQTLLDATNEGYDFVTIEEATGVNSNNIFFGNYYYTSSDFSNIYFRVKNGSPGELIYRGGSSYPKVPATLYVTLKYTKKETTDTPTADLEKTISANGSKGHHKFTLQVNETGTSGNGSLMSYTFKLSPVATGWDWADWTNASRTITYTITIGDNTYTGTIPSYNGSSTVTLKSGSGIAIEHDANGSKTINIGFTVKDTTGANYTSGNASASDTMILTKTS